MKKAVAKKVPIYDMIERGAQAPGDPRDINVRLFKCISTLLDSFDDMSPSEQIRCIAAIARVQISYNFGGNFGDGAIGATVRKYEKAFQANATRQRKAITGPAITDDDDDELGE